MGFTSTISNRIKSQSSKFYSDKDNIDKRLNIDLTLNQARQLLAEQNSVSMQNVINPLVTGESKRIYFLNVSLGMVKTEEISQGLI